MKKNDESIERYISKTKAQKTQKGEAIISTILGLCMIVMFGIATKYISSRTSNTLNQNSGDLLDDTEYASLDEIKLSKFSSKEELLDLLEKTVQSSYLTDEYSTAESIVFDADMAPALAGSSMNKEVVTENSSVDLSEKNYSTTNTQVKGVDEGDIVKTNGDYIYYISKGNIYIFNVKDEKVKLEKTIELGVGEYNVEELYIDNNYITVICNESVERNELFKETPENSEGQEVSDKLKNYYNDTSVVSVKIYDIKNYELVKTVKTEGYYVSSRKIEDNIYLVTNKYLYRYSINEKDILPIYFDSTNCDILKANKEETENNNNYEIDETYKEIPTTDICHLPMAETYKEIPATDISYFPNVENEQDCSYMIVTSIDLSNLKKEANIDVYLGAGTEIYCSKDHLYVTKVETTYKHKENIRATSDLDYIGGFSISPADYTTTTKIHKFELKEGIAKYVATGSVPGALLNQYSMDENGDYFRITTTSDDGNSLYVLNKKLEQVGKIENLAKGERIYATRFMGDKCYLVTYKTTDPLFVIDLSNPEKPEVLGELKLPGYSSYLHPLGENYLIGFGNESVEKNYIDWEGNNRVTAYDVGMKLAIFDVSDLNNPKELYSIRMGGRGSESELLNNPRVLYFDEEKGIFALPAKLTEETKYYNDGTPMYGKTVFDGVLVYDLSVENGISLRGKIEHKPEKDYSRYSDIRRVISIEDTLYTLSRSELKATNMNSMKEKMDLEF